MRPSRYRIGFEPGLHQPGQLVDSLLDEGLVSDLLIAGSLRASE